MSNLTDRFERHEAVVGIVGLGYVGLPLAATFADAGFAVIGFDVDADKVSELRSGRSYIRHIPPERFAHYLTDEVPQPGTAAFHPTDDFAKVGQCDAVVICVPTPLTRNREPDLSYVVTTAQTIARYLRPEQLIVLESTTYPGTTDEVVRPELEKSGLRAGKDFHLAFSPEREDPNNPNFNTKTIPKLVGGYTPECGNVACALYRAVLDRIVPVSSAQVAEAAKLLENIYRSVNIALVNELKVLFDRMGLNIWEIIQAAATKPFGYTPFFPGPGLGGHCIPIDPFYLTWKARQYDLATRFIELAGEVNHAMPGYVVEKVGDALNRRSRSINGANILILGVSYKRDLDDTRESPALKVMDLLQQKGAQVSYHDPYVPVLRRFRRYAFNLESVPLTREQLEKVDAVVITTDHGGIDYELVVSASKLVVDARNATANVREGREKIVLA